MKMVTEVHAIVPIKKSFAKTHSTNEPKTITMQCNTKIVFIKSWMDKQTTLCVGRSPTWVVFFWEAKVVVSIDKKNGQQNLRQIFIIHFYKK